METSINSIYYYQPNLSLVDTSAVFDISKEGNDLRVKNQNVNCLFFNLSAEIFDTEYNRCYRHLNLDFSPLTIQSKTYFLNDNEKEKLVQETITSWVYFYAVNNLPVQVTRNDFDGPGLMDHLLAILDKKYGTDTPISLSLGAKILRQDLSKYSESVKGRRRYYEK